MPDGIKFSELQSTLTLGNNDLAAVSHDNGDSTYTSVKVPMTQLGQKVVNDIDYTQALKTVNKKPIGAINELKEELLNIYPVLATSPASIANFNTDLALPLKSCKVETKPKQASGTPTPSNPLPISGTDTVIVTQTGANFWDEEWEQINTNQIASKNFCNVKGGATYGYIKPNGVWLGVYWYDETETQLSVTSKLSGTTGTVTAPDNAKYFKIVLGGSGTTQSGYNADFSLNYPSTDTTYHAHVTATTKTVSLPTTVYGGEVDVIGGSGESNKGFVTLDGTEQWTQSGAAFRTYQALPNANTTAGRKPVTCNIGPYLSSGTAENACWLESGWFYFCPPSSVTSEAEMAQWVSENNIQVCYPLATPTSITLANPISITALDGVNNVFGDTDGNTSVEYRESVQKYVDDNIAAVQALIL